MSQMSRTSTAKALRQLVTVDEEATVVEIAADAVVVAEEAVDVVAAAAVVTVVEEVDDTAAAMVGMAVADIRRAF